MYKLTARNEYGASVSFEADRAYQAIDKFDAQYARGGFEIKLYKLISYGPYFLLDDDTAEHEEDYSEGWNFVRFIKRTFR